MARRRETRTSLLATTTAMHLLLAVALAVVTQQDIVETANQKLLALLLNESYYDKDVRPEPADGSALVVTIIPNQFNLLTMDQSRETIEYFAEFMQAWTDSSLAWHDNETDYASEWIKIPERLIWTPDIVFDRSMSVKELIAKDTRMVDVRKDGYVRQSSPSVITTNCHLDIESFPYDSQECQIGIGPWMFDDSELRVVSLYDSVPIDDFFFEGNNEWDLVTMTATQSTTEDGQRNYSMVDYTMQLHRRPVYYVLVIQAPSFIVGTMTLFGIFTPFSVTGVRKERVSLGLTMLLSISMMLNLVSDMMPKAARLPLLGNYILIEIFICAVAVLWSIAILYAHHATHTRLLRPPRWLLRLLAFSECDCRAVSRTPASLKKLSERPAQIKAGLPLMLETDSCRELLQLLKLRTEIAKTVHRASRTMAFLERAEWIRLTWTRVFDTLDLLLLIIFQTLNVLIAIIYMQSPTYIAGLVNQTLASAPLKDTAPDALILTSSTV